MSKIVKNTGTAAIVLSTPLGKFIFEAGAAKELADDRAEAVQTAGKWYFKDGTLVVDGEATEEKPAAEEKQRLKPGPKPKTQAVDDPQ